jgi:hypothetical protein
MDELITATIRSSERPSYVHGPVPVTIMVTNISGAPISIQLAYPVSGNIAFECGNADIATSRPVERGTLRTVPIAIAPGRNYTATYYLNRYFRFHAAGHAIFAWHLTVPFKQGDSPTVTPEFQGSFPVELVLPPEQELRAELARYSKELRSSDPRARMEAAEALAFLDTPISVEYVAPMLSIEGLEITGIQALARFPSPRTYALITGMLSHKDSSVVGSALEEITRLNIPIERTGIRQLLASPNANTRWLAVKWLSNHPDPEDLASVRPLLRDGNSAVRELAKSYADALSKLQ